jgi:hypothetical protein
VQPERHVATQHLRLAELVDLLVEDREAVLHRLPEALLLADDHAGDEVAIALEIGVGVAHDLDRALDHRRHHELLAAEEERVTYRTTDDPPQHIAAVLVRGKHAIVHRIASTRGYQRSGGSRRCSRRCRGARRLALASREAAP